MRAASLRLATLPLRLLPPGSGQHRLVRGIFERRLADGSAGTAVARVGGSARFELELADYIQAQAFLTGRNDPALVRFISSRLRPRETFIDGGGHVGMISLAVAARVSTARVVALEPHPANAARFRRNQQLNPGLEVELLEVAAGAEHGIASLGSHDQGSDCYRLEDAGGGGAVEVKVEPIDALCAERDLAQVGVLKLDVEGHEPFALQGTRRMLREGRIATVVLELNEELLSSRGWSSERLCEMIAGFGYRRVEIPPAGLNRWRPGRLNYENVAFERR